MSDGYSEQFGSDRVGRELEAPYEQGLENQNRNDWSSGGQRGAVTESNEGADSDSNDESILERLKNLDPKDHIGTIATIGAAAIALGVGVYELKKHGKSISVLWADRHNENNKIISVVEKTERGGLAIGAAASAAAMKALGATKDVFAMEDGKVAYPLAGKEGDKEDAANRARKIAPWLIEALLSRKKKT